MKIVSFSVNRPVATAVIYLSLLVVGIFIQQDRHRSFSSRGISLCHRKHRYQGASPADIETQITKKIEDTVSEIDGIRHISSISMEDVSQVFIEFELSKKLDVVAKDVREKIDLIKNKLPDESDTPVIQKLDLNAAPVMNLALTGNRSLIEIYTLADEVITEKLSMAEGVASVEIVGGQNPDGR